MGGGGGGGGGGVGEEVGVTQNIMRALCAVVRPDHFKFASYGPGQCRSSTGRNHHLTQGYPGQPAEIERTC